MMKSLQGVQSVLIEGVREAEMTMKWKVFFSFPKKNVIPYLSGRDYSWLLKSQKEYAFFLYIGKVKWACGPDL